VQGLRGRCKICGQKVVDPAVDSCKPGCPACKAPESFPIFRVKPPPLDLQTAQTTFIRGSSAPFTSQLAPRPPSRATSYLPRDAPRILMSDLPSYSINSPLLSHVFDPERLLFNRTRDTTLSHHIPAPVPVSSPPPSAPRPSETSTSAPHTLRPSKTPSPPPTPPPRMANPLLPLLVLIVFLGLLGAIGYVVYSIASEVAEKTGEKMEKHHISLSKEGMRVKMKDVKQEDYVGGTQK